MDTLELLKNDFKLFLQALWAELDLPNPTRAQYAIADYLQHGPKRLQIQAFRGVGKSWITGAFVLWTLFNNAEKKIMIISHLKNVPITCPSSYKNLLLKRHGFLIYVRNQTMQGGRG